MGEVRSNRSEQPQRRQRDGHEPRQEGSRDDRHDDSDQAVNGRRRGSRPERPNDAEFAGVEADASADHLTRDHQHGECRNETEDTEGDGLGSQRLLRRRLNLGDRGEIERQTFRQRLRDLTFDTVLVGGPAHELKGTEGRIDAAREQMFR